MPTYQTRVHPVIQVKISLKAWAAIALATGVFMAVMIILASNV